MSHDRRPNGISVWQQAIRRWLFLAVACFVYCGTGSCVLRAPVQRSKWHWPVAVLFSSAPDWLSPFCYPAYFSEELSQDETAGLVFMALLCWHQCTVCVAPQPSDSNLLTCVAGRGRERGICPDLGYTTLIVFVGLEDWTRGLALNRTPGIAVRRSVLLFILDVNNLCLELRRTNWPE